MGNLNKYMNLQEEIILLREAIARMEIKLNACLDQEPRIRKLESEEDKRRGGLLILGGITGISSAAGALITMWLKGGGKP